MSRNSSSLSQVIARQSSSHRRTLSSSSSSSKLDGHARKEIKSTFPLPDLTTVGMISLSAVALSPMILVEQRNSLRRFPPRRAPHFDTWSEFSDLYINENRLLFKMEESKKLEAEIDEMMLRLGQTPDGKLGRR